jgi:N-acyl-D-aspartate/D-glutamate deacylase
MGMDDRPATTAELAEMRRLLRESIDQGAWGFSTGLVYPPGSYGETGEVLEIGRALSETNTLYASHIRNESDDVHVALKEALDIGRTLGVRTEISHLKAAGRQNHGRLPELVGMLDEARRGGLDVHSDGYPYDAGSTMLNQLIPPWAHDGGIEALVDRLRSPEQRARMRHDIEHGLPGWQNLVRAAGTWDRIIVASVTRPDLAWVQGKTVAELSAAAGVEPLEWTMDFLVEDFGAPVMIIRFMDPRDVDVAMTTPTEGMGSDQLAVTSDDARVHPRCYGTFVRFLAQFVRERNLVPMEQAIHRMTGMAADVVGVRDRGRVAQGLAADLVLFDPATVADRATYDEPTLLATGVEWVFVNGRPGVARGELVARNLGRVLRRPASA